MPELFSFVPLRYYTLYFDLLIMILVFFTYIQCARGNVFHPQATSINSSMGTIVMVFIILYMGLRNQYSSFFGDTVNYAHGFDNLAISQTPFNWNWKGEWFFYNLMGFIAKSTGDVRILFLLCALIYVGSLWLAMVRMFGDHYYIPFLVILSMFTFWTYGVNGMRNGMGASLFILALSFADNIPIMVFFAFDFVDANKSLFFC